MWLERSHANGREKAANGGTRAVLDLHRPGDAQAMSKTHAHRSGNGRQHVGASVLPEDLYSYIANEPWPHIGRPIKHDLSSWNVTDDWPEHIPDTEAEVDVFEAWVGDLFDELFGPCR
jgi:hypothetical protein